MESPKAAEHGLKLLTICPDNDHKLHNSCIMTSNPMSPPSSPSFSQVGDYIGTESCVDMKNDEADSDEAASSMGFGCQGPYQCKRDQNRRAMTTKREIPPPISLRMPFVLKRYYTADGRLILREERVRHHEYFKAHRSNGHLTLQLVLIDDHDDDDDFWYDEQCNAEEEEEEEEEVAEPELGTGDFGEKVEFIDKTDKVDKEVENGGENKCLNYSSVIRGGSSCFLGLPVPAIKPVHS